MSTARALSRALEADPMCVSAEMEIDGVPTRVILGHLYCEVHGVVHRIPRIEGQQDRKMPCPLCHSWVATWLLGHKDMDTSHVRVDKPTADKIDERICQNEERVKKMKAMFDPYQSPGGTVPTD